MPYFPASTDRSQLFLIKHMMELFVWAFLYSCLVSAAPPSLSWQWLPASSKSLLASKVVSSCSASFPLCLLTMFRSSWDRSLWHKSFADGALLCHSLPFGRALRPLASLLGDGPESRGDSKFGFANQHFQVCLVVTLAQSHSRTRRRLQYT